MTGPIPKRSQSFSDSTSIHYDHIPNPNSTKRTQLSEGVQSSSVESNDGKKFSYAFLSAEEQNPSIYFKNLNDQKYATLGNVYFESGKATLSEESLNAVRTFAEKANAYFKNNPTGTLTINAFTDRDGAIELNKALSEKRAESVASAVREYISPQYVERLDVRTSAQGESQANQRETLSSDRRASLVFSTPTTERYGVLVLNDESRKVMGKINIDMGHGKSDKQYDPNFDPRAPEGSASIVLTTSYLNTKGQPTNIKIETENPNNIRFLSSKSDDSFSIEPIKGEKNSFKLKLNGEEVAHVTFDLVGPSKNKEVKSADVKLGWLENSGSVSMMKESDMYSNILKQRESLGTDELIKEKNPIQVNQASKPEKGMHKQ